MDTVSQHTPPAWHIWKKLPPIPARTAIIAGVGAAVLLCVALFLPTLTGGDDANNQSVSQEAPAGSTQIGPLALTLPASAGTWTPTDQGSLDAAVQEANASGGKITSMHGYGTEAGASIIVSVISADAGQSLDAADQGMARLAEQLQLGDVTPAALTWTGALPSRSLQLDFGVGKAVTVFLELPDKSLIGLVATGPTEMFATGELATAALSAVYTG